MAKLQRYEVIKAFAGYKVRAIVQLSDIDAGKLVDGKFVRLLESASDKKAILSAHK